MALLRSLKTLRSREHSSQNAPGHRLDKIEGDARAAEQWLVVPRQSGINRRSRDFSRVPGQDYAMQNGVLRVMDSREFVSFLNTEHKLRIRYRGMKKRGGRISECAIKGKASPLVELTVTVSPWGNDTLAEGAALAPFRVASVMFQLGSGLIQEIESSTGCKVIGMTIHTDTDDLHLNFQLARVNPDKDGIMRLTGTRGLGLSGGWMVGVARQRSVGIRNGLIDTKFERALERWRLRNPTRGLPLDINLARLLDGLLEQILGGMDGLKAAYRHRVETARNAKIDQYADGLRKQLMDLERNTLVSFPHSRGGEIER